MKYTKEDFNFFTEKVESAYNRGLNSYSFQLYGWDSEKVDFFARKAKREGFRFIKKAESAEVNF